MAEQEDGGLRRVVRRARRAVTTAPPPMPDDESTRWTSPLIDPWYYGLQLGREVSAAEAARHYLAEGASSGLLPNPLTDVLATGLGPDAVAAAMADGSARAFPIRAILDDIALMRLSPRAAEHPGGPAGFYLEHAHDEAPVPEIAGKSWRQFVRLRKRQATYLTAMAEGVLFDREYYEAQLGFELASTTAAMWHFLEEGAALGLAPNVLFEPRWYRSKGAMWSAFTHFLDSGQTHRPAGPHFDASAYLQHAPQAAEHAGGPLGHYLAHADGSALTFPDRKAGTSPIEYLRLRSTMIEQARRRSEQQRATGAPARHARWWVARAEPAESDATDAIAILTDVRDWGTRPQAGLRSLLEQRHEAWTVRVAVDVGEEVPADLAQLAADDPRFVLVRTAARSWPGRVHDLLAVTEEPWVAFWKGSERWSPRCLSGLLAAADESGAHATVIEDAVDPAGAQTWFDRLPDTAAPWWGVERDFRGMLLPTRLLRADGVLRADDDEQGPWDILLDQGLGGPYVPFVASRDARRDAPSTDSYDVQVRSRHLIDWREVAAAAGRRAAGRTSVVVVAGDAWRGPVAAVRSILAAAADADDLEIVVVDDGGPPGVSSVLAAVFCEQPAVRVVRLPRRTHFATAANAGFAESTGEAVIFLGPDTVVPAGWQEPLVAALGGDDVLGAQPVVLRPEGTVSSAGVVFNGPYLLPSTLLANHPIEDLRPDVELRFSAATAPGLCVSAKTFIDARGFDARFVDGLEDVDLCLRIGAARPGHFVVVPHSQIVASPRACAADPAQTESNQLRFLDRWGATLPGPQSGPWRQAGFEVAARLVEPPVTAGARRTTARTVLVRPSSVVADGPAAGLPSLRWAVKHAAPAGPRGNAWGDTFFAADLAAGLRHWGQEVVVDRRESLQRPGTDDLDDVAVWLRGRAAAVPQPATTNVLWIISHPDAVPREELQAGFDVVYAASRPWSAWASRESGVHVRPLLQATNPDRFSPDGPASSSHGALFVGNTRNVMRPIVRDVIAAGIPVQVYGKGWEQFIDPAYVVDDHLDNADLPAAYRGAAVVLNDHWADMAQHSMFSNRLFDAVASGARVISDPVDGLEEIFGSSVRTYAGLDDLHDLARPDSDRWPDAETTAARAAAVAAEHSFVERARVMLADVLDARGVPHDLRRGR